MGSPAGSSGSGQGSTVYNPANQPQADTLYQSILGLGGSSGLGALAQNPSATPAGLAYGMAQPLITGDVINNPGSSSLVNGSIFAGGLGTNAGNLASAAAPQLQGAASSILNTAFDPQGALYNQLYNQTLQQANAANAMSGVNGTPYGQATLGNTLNNFNLNWQNNLLNRMATGASAATGLDQGAQSVLGAGLSNLSTGTGAEYNAYQNYGTNVLNSLSSLANLGNNQYVLPQQVLNDLQSYLGLGQSASQLSGQLGQMGQNELGQSLAGIGGGLSLANTLSGNSISSGIGSLFGGSSGLSGTGLSDLVGSQGFATAPFTDLAASTASAAPSVTGIAPIAAAGS